MLHFTGKGIAAWEHTSGSSHLCHFPAQQLRSTGWIRETNTHTGSSAAKAKGNLREAVLRLSNNTGIMQFYLADFTRGFPHPSASHGPVGQIKASGAHPFPSGTEESTGVAVLTQKEKEQSRDKAGCSWWSTAGLCSCLLTAPGVLSSSITKLPPCWQLSSPASHHLISQKSPGFLLQVFPPGKQGLLALEISW